MFVKNIFFSIQKLKTKKERTLCYFYLSYEFLTLPFVYISAFLFTILMFPLKAIYMIFIAFIDILNDYKCIKNNLFHIILIPFSNTRANLINELKKLHRN